MNSGILSRRIWLILILVVLPMLSEAQAADIAELHSDIEKILKNTPAHLNQLKIDINKHVDKNMLIAAGVWGQFQELCNSEDAPLSAEDFALFKGVLASILENNSDFRNILKARIAGFSLNHSIDLLNMHKNSEACFCALYETAIGTICINAEMVAIARAYQFGNQLPGYLMAAAAILYPELIRRYVYTTNEEARVNLADVILKTTLLFSLLGYFW